MSGGHFLGRGRILRFRDTAGTAAERNRFKLAEILQILLSSPPLSRRAFLYVLSGIGSNRKMLPVPLSTHFFILLLFLQYFIKFCRSLFNDGTNNCPDSQVTQHKNTGKDQNRSSSPFQPAVEQIRSQIADI